jgi:hypothetical protein
MTSKDCTTSYTVEQTADEVFAAVNNVRGSWSDEIDGTTDRPGGEFTYRYQDIHRPKLEIIELVPGKRVIWCVLDAEINFVNRIALHMAVLSLQSNVTANALPPGPSISMRA